MALLEMKNSKNLMELTDKDNQKMKSHTKMPIYFVGFGLI